MNYFEEVAKLLGLELEEEFGLKLNEFIYKITERGFYTNKNYVWKESMVWINDLTPENIIKLPWKPKLGETYFSINPQLLEVVQMQLFRNDIIDELLLKRGLVFKTEEEALEKVKELGW